MKRIKKILLSFVCLLLVVAQASAQVDSVVWDFTGGSPTHATNLTWANYACSSFTVKGGGAPSVNATAAVGSSGNGSYTPSSKGNNLAVSCSKSSSTFKFDSAYYIEWTMEPDPGKQIVLTHIEFGARSTASGPKAWTLRSSHDSYSTDLVSPGAILADSKWAFRSVNLATPFQGGVGKTIVFRLYLYNANGGANNFRLDDIKIRTGNTTSEPKIRLSTRNLNFITALGVNNTESFTVQGLALSQNISATSTNPKFTVDKSSISYTAANSAAQVVNVTFDGSADAVGKIILKTTAGGLEISDTVKVAGATTTGAFIAVSIPKPTEFYLEYTPVLVGGLTTQMVELSGKSLTDSISIIPPVHSAFSVSATKMSKNANRDYVFIYYHPVQEEVVLDTLILRSSGVADVRIPIRAQAVRTRTDLLPPLNYYGAAKRKTGAELKTALYNAVKGHTIVPYSEAWTAYGWLDVRPECDLYVPDASVWDIYTDRPGCTPDNSRCVPNFQNPIASPCSGFKVLRMGTDQTSSTNPGGSLEGVSYEREHTFPKGWWAAAKNSGGAYRETSPMYCDLFHLYPCDHRVNNLRNDNPYGEVSVPTANGAFTNGSKLGINVASGAPSTTAYEPIDEYKGDIARNYFYMVTRYENTVQHWSKNITWGGAYYDEVVAIAPGLHANASPMIDTNSYPVFKPWALDMLLKWHRLDPVSEKEQQRNQMIYDKFQHNRNPFIDHPEMVEYIWGSKVGQPWGASIDSIVATPDSPELGEMVSVKVYGAADSIWLCLYDYSRQGSIDTLKLASSDGRVFSTQYVQKNLKQACRVELITGGVSETVEFFEIHTSLPEISGVTLIPRYSALGSLVDVAARTSYSADSVILLLPNSETVEQVLLAADSEKKSHTGEFELVQTNQPYTLVVYRYGLLVDTFSAVLKVTLAQITSLSFTPQFPTAIGEAVSVVATTNVPVDAVQFAPQQNSENIALTANANGTTFSGTFTMKETEQSYRATAWQQGVTVAADSGVIKIISTSAVGDQLSARIQLFPNPNSGEFSLVLPGDIELTAVEVYSVDGIAYPCRSIGAQRYKVDAPSGIYLVKIITEKGVGVRKFSLTR